MNAAELKWLPIPLDLWVPAGLKDFQEGWFFNLLRASLRSEYLGYLILCEEGCSGCSACLWRVANAHHPEHFKKHCSLVLACFDSAQIAERRVLYFPKLIETIKGQLSKIRNHRSRRSGLSETSTGFNKGSGDYSPSDSLFFDFDLDSKKQNPKTNIDCDLATTMEGSMADGSEPQKTDVEKGAGRILRILGLSESNLSAAMAAVEFEIKRTGQAVDDIVISIHGQATRARRDGASEEEFLANFLAYASARRLLQIVNLSEKFVYRIAAVLKAEAADTGLSLEDAARRLANLASGARQKGEEVNIFYFEDVRWRSNARNNKAEQRKLDNLEVNARVKRRIRERFGAS